MTTSICSGVTPYCTLLGAGATCVQCTTSAQCGAGASCSATGQCVSSCTPSCVGKACGDDGCGGSCGTCSAGEMCNGAFQCILNQVFLNPSPGSVTVTAGDSFDVSYNVTPNDASLLLVHNGWPLSASIDQGTRMLGYVTTSADVGSYTLSVSVQQAATGQTWAQSSIGVTVACNPADATVGACCNAASGKYLATGAACAYSSTETGTCTASHTCVEVCAANVAQQCNNNVVTYVDSCGQWGDVSDDCNLPATDGANRTCVELNGRASCVEQPPSCTGQYAYECRGSDGVKIDRGCGQVTTVTQCTTSQACNATATGVTCQAKGPCAAEPGTINCDTRCVNPMTSRTDCGACDRACTQTEQCVQGNCAPIPGCNVVCDSNAQCGQGEVCVYAGDCMQSQCQAINVLDQTPSTVEPLAQALLEQGLVRVDMTIQGPVITYTVTNLGPDSVENISLTSTIGKVITQDASTLTVAGVAYTVLKNDPILQFTIPELATTKTFTVTANHVLDTSYIDFIQNVLTYDTTGDLLDSWNKTREALTLGLNSEYNGNRTTFHLSLTPSKALNGVSVPLEIPKCLAQNVADLKLSGNYHVIKDDPLIVWQFDRLDQPTEITFSVPKNVSDDCKAQLNVMAYSQTIGKPINPLLALALVPLIGFVILFFQRFTPGGGKAHVSRSEFAAIAKEQGFDKEEIERQWREYQRRF